MDRAEGQGAEFLFSFFFLRLARWKLVEFDGQLEVQRWILTDVGSLRTLLLCEKKGLIRLHVEE